MNRQEQTCKRALTVERKRHRHLEVKSEDVAFSRAHIAKCSNCLAASAVIREMLDSGNIARFDDLSARREADAILARLASMTADTKRVMPTPFQKIGWAAVGMAVATVLVGLGLLFYRSSPFDGSPVEEMAASQTHVEPEKEAEENTTRAPVQNVPKALPVASAESTEKATQRKTARTKAPHFKIGDTAREVLLGDGIQLLAKPHSELSLTQSDDLAVTVALLNGQVLVSVDPTKSTPVVSILTRSARVTVTGTIFSVTSNGDEQRVSVLKGEVMVTGRSKDVRLVSSGEQLSLDMGMPKPVPEAILVSLEKDLKRLEWTEKKSATCLDWRPDTLKALGNSPSIERGSFDTSVSGDDHTSRTTDVRSPQSAIRILLLDARRYRREGNWSQLAKTYHRLIEEYSGTQEAASATVALADVQLRHLKKPRAALVLYERYLRLGEHTLREEALIGEADALERLGRASEARAVLEAFVAEYPHSIHTSGAEHRLTEIR